MPCVPDRRDRCEAKLTDTIVLGAGMVGVSVAIHLQRRGRNVLLVDRREPGRETSYGNAGIIQREAVRPRAFPRELSELFRIGMKRGLDTRYDVSALPALASPLFQYWWNSAPARYRKIAAEYATIIAHSITEHTDFIAASGAEHLISKGGFLLLFRSAAQRDATFRDAEGDKRTFGVNSTQLSGEELAKLEPAILQPMAGALHWTDPWTVRDPGGLVGAYAELFRRMAGTIAVGDATTLESTGAGWTVTTSVGRQSANEVVLALGPWAASASQRLGYNFPLFVKRGYHRHYAYTPDGVLGRPALDTERGYLLAPMVAGTRLTTGAEFARLDAPPNETQIDGTEAIARELIHLGDRVEAKPWLGARPATPDMKPIIGPAPRHKNLWFAFGHAHQGHTLGPVTGRLLAEQMLGEPTVIDPTPFRAERFMR